jgi:PAS domain S-box-containing protein
MPAFAVQQGFLRSRSAHGLAVYLAFSCIVAIVVAWGFYQSSLNWFTEHKSEEKVTALRLVDAFVQNYSELRGKLGPDAPVPATFRAHSIDLFNRSDKKDAAEFRLRWVGRENRAIATPPGDAATAAAIESFAHEKAPKAISEFRTVGGNLVFRTIYPSLAQQQSCVDCHNAIQPDQHWKLGDVMGAFSIDVPAGAAIQSSAAEAAGLGLALFLALGAFGTVVARLAYRQGRVRQAVEESLRDSEERFRDFAASASDWFWEMGTDLRFTFVSQGAPHAAGDVLGRTRRELVAAGENFGITEAMLQAHEDDLEARRSFQEFRMQQVTTAGEVRHVSLSGRPVFDLDGCFKGYRGSGRDVTAGVAVEVELGRRVEERTAELRTAQGELVRREKLSTLGQLTATVAHELRNPLSAIRNTIFAIRENVAQKGLDLERPLARVDRNIQRCDRIISDLLDFTRMPELRRVPIAVDQWLDEILAEQALPDGVSVARDFGAPNVEARFDAERMRCVVINLIENAAQAMGERGGGSVTLHTRVSGSIVAIAVEDTGPGIPADVLPKVFEPLFSTKSFGTGLGLPTVKQIVEQHGGSVDIASEPGKGTRVVVRLPGVVEKEMAA